MRYCKFIFLIVASVLFAECSSAFAAELIVSKNGTYKTIQQAIRQAQPGDIIKLTSSESPYYESAIFHNKAGTKEKPIILDGQGATLDGSEILRKDEWQEISPGLYKSSAFAERTRMKKSILGRYFFLFDGKINRMGGVSKGKRAHMKAPTDLADNEWTYIEDESTFYVKIANDKKLSSVSAPVRSSGVALRGDCQNIIIRNITATHVWNDGFNIHHHCYDILFENIRAIECGDDGISAHEDSTISVNGMLSRGNATGFCHIGQTKSDTRNIVIEDCAAYGVYLLDNSSHTLRNCIIRGKSTFALRLARGTSLNANDVQIIGAGPVKIAEKSTLAAQQILSENAAWEIDEASVALSHSTISGNVHFNITHPQKWESNYNEWGVQQIKWNGKTYDKSTFSAYVRDSKQDEKSRLLRE